MHISMQSNGAVDRQTIGFRPKTLADIRLHPVPAEFQKFYSGIRGYDFCLLRLLLPTAKKKKKKK